MEFYFVNTENIHDRSIIPDKFEQKHIINTMRKKEGDILHVIDGAGGLYKASIIQTRPQLKLQILEQENKPKPNIKLALAVAFIKPTRLELILEKGTELGVTHFFLFRSRFTNYKSDNLERYTKKLRQALKQSLQYYQPQIAICDDLDDLIIKTNTFNSRFIAVDGNQESFLKKLKSDKSQNDAESAVLVIGPEGGFEEKELSSFKSAGYNFISLGSTRLRAETAAISGFSILKSYFDHLLEGAV